MIHPGRISLRLPECLIRRVSRGIKALSINSLRSALTPRLAGLMILRCRRREFPKLVTLWPCAPSYTLCPVGTNSRAGHVDLKKLLRHPQKGDLLLPAPTPLYAYGLDPADACVRGYRLAAKLVVDRIRQRSSEQSILFYPAVFLCRHSVELMLKRLILAFNQPSVRRLTQADELTDTELAALNKGQKAHSLQWLWEKVRPAAQALGEDVISPESVEGINFYIQQLNEIDSRSVNFRYTTEIEETRAKLTEAQKPGAEVDLVEFAEAIERLANYLDGLDSYIAGIIEYEQEMWAEAQDSSY